MTNTKHTPGPWSVGFLEDPSIRWDICRADGRAIAMPFLTEVDGQHKANARLIAAAPELLSAAEHALDLFNKGASNWGQSAKDALRAAIAKARGEQA